jgi:hypothetical protein
MTKFYFRLSLFISGFYPAYCVGASMLVIFPEFITGIGDPLSIEYEFVLIVPGGSHIYTAALLRRTARKSFTDHF